MQANTVYAYKGNDQILGEQNSHLVISIKSSFIQKDLITHDELIFNDL